MILLIGYADSHRPVVLTFSLQLTEILFPVLLRGAQDGAVLAREGRSHETLLITLFQLDLMHRPPGNEHLHALYREQMCIHASLGNLECVFA